MHILSSQNHVHRSEPSASGWKKLCVPWVPTGSLILPRLPYLVHNSSRCKVLSWVFSKETMPQTTLSIYCTKETSLKTISGRGGNQIGANFQATAKRSGWRNPSNLCLSMLRSSVEKMGMQATTDPHCMSITTRATIQYSLSNTTNKRHTLLRTFELPLPTP